MYQRQEEYHEENCGNCDNCLHPKKKVEAKELLSAVLEVVGTLKEKFKAEYIVNMLVGNETSEIQSYKHNELEIFGSGSDEEEKTWNAVIRQALIAGYLAKDIENYGLLKITEKGKEFIKKPVSFKITEDNEFDEEEEEVPVRGGAACAVDPALFSMMKDLRKKLSKRLEVPPFVIFQDPSLEAMATIYPVTLDELQNIPGVGAGKAKRYGEEFCKLIKRHCEENEIERPEDLRVRTVANKSKMKVSKWLEMDGVKDYEHFLVKWHSLTKSLRQTMQNYNEEEAKRKNMLFLQMFYFTPVQQENFYDGFYERLEQFERR